MSDSIITYEQVWGVSGTPADDFEKVIEILSGRILQLEAALKFYGFGPPSDEYPFAVPDDDCADRTAKRAAWLARDAGRLARNALQHANDDFDYEPCPPAWLQPPDRKWLADREKERAQRWRERDARAARREAKRRTHR